MSVYGVNYDFFNNFPELFINSVAHLLASSAENMSSIIGYFIVLFVFGLIIFSFYLAYNISTSYLTKYLGAVLHDARIKKA